MAKSKKVVPVWLVFLLLTVGGIIVIAVSFVGVVSKDNVSPVTNVTSRAETNLAVNSVEESSIQDPWARTDVFPESPTHKSSFFKQPPTQGAPQGINLRLVRDGRVEGRRVGVLVQDWMYCYPPTGDIIIVPAGYASDFASIPGWATHFIDVMGNNIEAAVVHDWLYSVGEPGRKNFADEVLRYALKEQKVDLATRNAMFSAVQVGGGSAYGRSTEWSQRFGDAFLGKFPIAPPYEKPKSGVITRVSNCKLIESDAAQTEILTKFGSDTWPKAPNSSN